MSEQCVTSGVERASTVFRVDLSILAHLVPPALVRQVLAQTQVVARTRRTSAVSGVYLVLAMTLFPQVGLSQVFEKLTGVCGRGGQGVPSRSSLRKRRAGLGAGPFRLLLDHLAGAGPGAARWRGLLVCAVDGTTLEVPDTRDNRVLGKKSNQHGAGAYPRVRLLVLVACGTRALLAAACDGVGVGETTLAVRLLAGLRTGMLLLADRGFPGYELWCRCAGTGAQLLWRVQSNLSLPVDTVLPDGSGLAWWSASSKVSKARRAELGIGDRIRVRVICGWITVIDPNGVRRSEPYRLVTTLTDPKAYPAQELIRLYARRWQVELMIKGLKCVQLASGTLRSKTCNGVLQEAWAALCMHQLLRLQAATGAADADAEIRQIGFTTLVNRLRDAIVRTGGRRGAAAELSRLRRATATDITPIDLRIRRYDRVVKHPVAKFPSKRAHHHGGFVTIDYTIDAFPAQTTAQTTAHDQHEPYKINC